LDTTLFGTTLFGPDFQSKSVYMFTLIIVTAVLPGVLDDSVDDCKHTWMGVWMKLIHNALDSHLNSPAVQVS